MKTLREAVDQLSPEHKFDLTEALKAEILLMKKKAPWILDDYIISLKDPEDAINEILGYWEHTLDMLKSSENKIEDLKFEISQIEGVNDYDH